VIRLRVAVVVLALIALGGVVLVAWPTPESRASDPASGDPVIVAVGDMACDPSNTNFRGGNGSSTACKQLSTSNGAVSDPTVDAFLGLGDYQYVCDQPEDFPLSYDLSWGRLDAIAHPAAGNHEYQTGSDGAGGTCPASNTTAGIYFSYFGAAAHPESGGHYSFNLGSWHLIALNANCPKSGVGGCSATSPQTKWLAADLAANTQPCVLAYWHQPRWTGQSTQSTTTAAWWSLLYQNHADVVLNGHMHVYMRFGYLNPSGTADPNGLREVVVGTGGASVGGGTTNPVPFPQVRLKTYGYLRMVLHPTGYDAQFIDRVGVAEDAFSGTCH